MRQSSGVSSARDGMVKDQAGSTKTPMLVFGGVILLATQAHGCYFMSWGMNIERRFYESFVFHGWWQGWSRESIDVRSPAESRNVVGVRLVFSMLGIWALEEEAGQDLLCVVVFSYVSLLPLLDHILEVDRCG
jgi:hypothetical protein